MVIDAAGRIYVGYIIEIVWFFCGRTRVLASPADYPLSLTATVPLGTLVTRLLVATVPILAIGAAAAIPMRIEFETRARISASNRLLTPQERKPS